VRCGAGAVGVWFGPRGDVLRSARYRLQCCRLRIRAGMDLPHVAHAMVVAGH